MSSDIDREIEWSPDGAARVVQQIRIIGRAFNELTKIASEDLEAEQQRVVRRALGGMLGPLIGEVLMPIEDKFPDLDCSLGEFP